MLQSLKKRWNVTGRQLVVILCVFAITGFSTAWLSKAVTGWAGFTAATHWALKLSVRLVVLIFGYQVILLTVAALFGQARFFWQYEKKMLTRLGILKKQQPAVKQIKRKQKA